MRRARTLAGDDDALELDHRQRGRHEPEYELLDTGVFDDNRYFDVFVEYAKAAPEDLLVRISDDAHAEQACVKNVLLAVRLARHTAQGWDNAALPDDVADIAAMLNLSHGAALQLIEQIER